MLQHTAKMSSITIATSHYINRMTSSQIEDIVLHFARNITILKDAPNDIKIQYLNNIYGFIDTMDIDTDDKFNLSIIINQAIMDIKCTRSKVL